MAVKYKITVLSAHFFTNCSPEKTFRTFIFHYDTDSDMFEDLLQAFSYLQIKSNVFGMTSLKITLPYLVVHPLLTTQAFIIYRYEEQYEVPI